MSFDLWPFFFIATGFLAGLCVKVGWRVAAMLAHEMRVGKICYKSGFRDCATQALKFIEANGPTSAPVYLKTVIEHEWK